MLAQLGQLQHTKVKNPRGYARHMMKMFPAVELEALAVKKFGSAAALAAEWQFRRDRRCVHAEGVDTAGASAAGTASRIRDMATQRWPSKQERRGVAYNPALFHALMRGPVSFTPEPAGGKKSLEAETLMERADRAGLTPREISTALASGSGAVLQVQISERLADGRTPIPGRQLQLARDLGFKRGYAWNSNSVAFFQGSEQLLPFSLATAAALHFDFGVPVEKLRDIKSWDQADCVEAGLRTQQESHEQRACVTPAAIHQPSLQTLPSAVMPSDDPPSTDNGRPLSVASSLPHQPPPSHDLSSATPPNHEPPSTKSAGTAPVRCPADTITGPHLDELAQDRLPGGNPRGAGRPRLNPGLEAIPRPVFNDVPPAGGPSAALAAPASIPLSVPAAAPTPAPAVPALWSSRAGGPASPTAPPANHPPRSIHDPLSPTLPPGLGPAMAHSGGREPVPTSPATAMAGSSQPAPEPESPALPGFHTLHHSIRGLESAVAAVTSHLVSLRQQGPPTSPSNAALMREVEGLKLVIRDLDAGGIASAMTALAERVSALEAWRGRSAE
ncbi:MAG: hypothetical protein WDW36_009187 [Sanguina aurantia]